jgi:4'-phosphopantetheinyl transferase
MATQVGEVERCAMLDSIATQRRLHWTAQGVDVFYVDLGRHYPSAERDALAWLSSEERVRGQLFVCPQARHQYIICRASLRALISERLGCRPLDIEISAGQHGKPSAMIRDHRVPVEFSVSHSENHGLIALSTEGAVGIDVEEMKPRQNFSSIAQSVFTLDEQECLAQTSGEDTMRCFYRIWTLKEAVVKAIGMGLPFGLESFSIPDELICDASSSYLILPRRTQKTSYQMLNLFALPGVGRAAVAVATFAPIVSQKVSGTYRQLVASRYVWERNKVSARKAKRVRMSLSRA